MADDLKGKGNTKTALKRRRTQVRKLEIYTYLPIIYMDYMVLITTQNKVQAPSLVNHAQWSKGVTGNCLKHAVVSVLPLSLLKGEMVP